jgi:EmrB/QacA subfamily drug resistance transporter
MTAVDPARPVVTPQERRLTLAALMVVLLLSSLDQTVVGVAMPRIIAELHGLSLIAWLTTAYMLTSTVFVPIYGKLSDLYGRKTILVFGIVVFLLGSWLCGASGEFGDLPLIGGGMNQLILFRAIQGIGGAALFTMTFTIIADLFEPRERGKFMGIFASVFGISLVLGPLAGGFFTDLGTVSLFGQEFAGWRGVFYVNVPIGLLALFMIAFKMPTLGRRVPGRVDYLGAIFFMAAVTPFLLALTWGNQYGWLSPRVLSSFGAAIVSLGIFFAVEVGNPDALMPLGLFRNRVFSIANAAAFLVSMAFMGVISFLPLYMQVVRGVDATKSGLSMLPLLGGLMATSVLSGFLASKTGRYKPFILAGYVGVLVGVILLSRIGPDTTTLDLGWRMFIVGIGIGPTQSLFNLAIQNAVPAAQIATATSTSQFFRQIGSTVGVTLFGTMLTGSLLVELPKQLPAIPGMSTAKVDMGEAQSQAMNPNRIHDKVAQAFDDQYNQFDRAYHGDQAAVAAVLDNPAVPDGMKTKLRAGDTANAEQTLKAIRQALDHRLPDLVAKLERGTKVAFSNAITSMFKNSWAIVALGIAIAVFLPEIPLRQRAKPGEETVGGSDDETRIVAAAE